MLDPSQLRQLEREGFLAVRGLLDPNAELAALSGAYQDLVEALALGFFAEAGAPLPAAFGERPLGERFALLYGASGGRAVEHLDPLLSSFDPSHVRRADLPGAQLPELFRLFRAAPLLDTLEPLLGGEIDGSPTYHVNLKLAPSQLALAREIARGLGREDPTTRPFHAFLVGDTAWHRDALYGLADAHESHVVVAWVPLTPAGGERGSLRLLPGSHRERDAPPPPSERGVEIAAVPGDVVFFDHWLLHGGTPNRSVGEVRWSVSFRYLPGGQPAGRPYLPTVRLRSRSDPRRELRNPILWAALWRRALDHLVQPDAAAPRVASADEARAITKAWRSRVPDEAAWLRLAPAPGLAARFRRSAGALRWALSSGVRGALGGRPPRR